MDLLKIGRYIASKRKALGMTQMDLAKELGMSDKSVSKWERGICLPDASIYMQLCDALGISINEFFAGEDLENKDIIKQSEENIINITLSDKKKYTRLQRAFFIISALYFVCICVMIIIKVMPGLNYIGPVEEFSKENIIAETIYDEEDVMLFNYNTDDGHERIDLVLTEYQDGKLISKNVIDSFYTADKNLRQGVIMVVPDYSEFNLKVIVANKNSDFNDPVVIPIMSDVAGRSAYKHYAIRIDENKHLSKREEIPLGYVEYSRNKVERLPIDTIGNEVIDFEDGYVYAISVLVDFAN